MEDAEGLQAAYQRLAEAVGDVSHLEGARGVLMEWLVVTATQQYDADGDNFTQVGTLLPDGGAGMSYHRMLGLLDYAHARMRAEVCKDD